MKKVKSQYLGAPHFIAHCYGCNWRYENYLDQKKGYRETKKHVAATGHIVDVEKGLVTRYSPEEDVHHRLITAAANPETNV